ncbi:uncharacterized protein NEMAJ01_0346 [Nematocida major]|uniref:uncharacterized protein n=1 Tax=Nematocida major TaxID=1912982 RepID=UPI002008A2C8|nr:uncharacterized protein NEMAJ01_0346 [Nematocida major]KAH9385450.1 hypothetical protein NEMAJ01_0346 [Nematocida major]
MRKAAGRKTADRKKQKAKGIAKKRWCIFLAGLALLGLCALWWARESPIDFNKLEYIVSLPSDTRQHPLQLEAPIREFRGTCTEKDKHIARKRYVIVQSRYKKTLVCSAFVVPYHYRGSDEAPESLFLVFEVYSVYVNPKYRGKRLSISHLYRTFKMLRKVYGVKKGEKCYLALHISPMDRDMDKAYALYRTNGFVNGMFTEDGPYSLRKKSELLMGAGSIDTALANYPYYNQEYTGKKMESGPRFLTMIAGLDVFFKTVEMNAYTKSDYNYHRRKAEKLRKPLLQQYVYPR